MFVFFPKSLVNAMWKNLILQDNRVNEWPRFTLFMFLPLDEGLVLTISNDNMDYYFVHIQICR